MEEPQYRMLVPGRDITRWAEMKIARARELLAGLRGQMDTWSTTGGVHALPSLSEDGTRIEIRAAVVSQAPVDIWAMQFGEAVHQLRASLDALAWDCAHLDGNQPADPRAVYFPVKESEAKWAAARKGALSSIPDDILDRLEQAQPYQPVPGGIPFLGVLHGLDIQDKHKGLLTGGVRFRRIAFDGLQFELPTDITDAEAASFAWHGASAIDLVDGAYIGYWQLPRAIAADALIPGPLAVNVEFVVSHEKFKADFSQVVTEFPDMTELIYKGICRGFQAELEPNSWPVHIAPSDDDE